MAMNRTEALCWALGWQGGTVHQVAEATGLTTDQIIFGEKPQDTSLASPHCMGWFAARTCSLEVNREKNFPRRKGDYAFWCGVVEGVQKAEAEGTLHLIR